MTETIKRLHSYFKVMYPIPQRLVLGYIVAMEIYFIVVLNHGITFSSLEFGPQELVLGFTVFSFLCWLRIADDFKDYELDCRLFPDRPLPSGQVHKKDLKMFISMLIIFTLLLNWFLMPHIHFVFCVILYTYGSLMAVWFFQKHKISKCLPLALFTHNPVQLILNIYIISFAIIRYRLPVFDLTNVLAVLTLYFPALIWEVTRKIRAPRDETEYVTYSKLFGYRKATEFAFAVTWIDIITNFILVWNLNKVSVALLLADVLWMSYIFLDFRRDPTRYKLVDKVERYTYIQESLMIATIVLYLFAGKI